MAFDHTAAFKTVLSEQLRKLPSSARSKSPSRSYQRKGKGKAGSEEDEEFLKEAYKIHHHLTALQLLLTSVRKAYLSTVEPPPLSRRAPRPRLQDRSSTSSSYLSQEENDDHALNEEEEEWRKWEKVKYLSDRERDEIDLRARMILRRCKDRVGVLERAEQARKSKSPSQSTTANAIYSLLPSLAPSSSTTVEPLIAAHRLSVLWTLNDFLAKLTSVVGGMQEERSKRREERSKTLGGGASAEAARMNFQLSPPTGADGRTVLDGLVVNVEDPALTPGSNQHGIGILPSAEPPIESILSPEQIQMFESENNALLEHMSSTLSSVLSAEQSLLEISQLQSELVRHLAQQTEVVEQLYEDAVGSVGDVGRANEQLKKASERGKEGRLFLLIFLVGASMALLFLDWYAS